MLCLTHRFNGNNRCKIRRVGRWLNTLSLLAIRRGMIESPYMLQLKGIRVMLQVYPSPGRLRKLTFELFNGREHVFVPGGPVVVRSSYSERIASCRRFLNPPDVEKIVDCVQGARNGLLMERTLSHSIRRGNLRSVRYQQVLRKISDCGNSN